MWEFHPSLWFFSPPSTFCPDGSISSRGISTTRSSISCHDKHFQRAFQLIFHAESCLFLFATEKGSGSILLAEPLPSQFQHPCPACTLCLAWKSPTEAFWGHHGSVSPVATPGDISCHPHRPGESREQLSSHKPTKAEWL